MSTLYLIGASADNFQDLSLEALRILGEADFILSEDERAAGKLLARYKIKIPPESYNQSGKRQIERTASWLAAGKNIVLILESGLPGISDSGGKLAQAIMEKFGGAINVELIPGASAVTAALSLSGLAADKFIFLGRPPRGRERPKFIRRVLESVSPAVIYESRFNLESFLKELTRAARENRQVNKKGKLELKPINLTVVVACRELEKKRETVYRGEIGKIIEKIKENKDEEGELIIITGK